MGNPTLEIAYFYPRSPCGERQSVTTSFQGGFAISIHALLAESDVTDLFTGDSVLHFYPRSPCGERQGAMAAPITPTYISIHALLAESDIHNVQIKFLLVPISIHALLAESDFVIGDVMGKALAISIHALLQHFSISYCKISIHALLAESDVFRFCFSAFDFLFLSTLSLRRATECPSLLS